MATVHALGALTAIFLTLFVGRQVRPSTAEVVFGLINVPATPTFLSIVVLALVTGALVFRKRIGLWFVAAFQLLGTYLGLVELLNLRLPLSGVWETRGDLGRGLDLLSIAMSGVILAVLWRVRPIFRVGCVAAPGGWRASPWRRARPSRAPRPGSCSPPPDPKRRGCAACSARPCAR
ncbi:MAG: hypothetical protein LKG20_04195 [Tetrasphaera jenkinsii]|nr:hypothetical protein [Tetrasphaera jenkinsii]